MSAIGIISVLLILSAYAIDLGRVMYYKHQLQSMADAVSLAGASATYSVRNGDEIDTLIDSDRAEVEAYTILKINAFTIYHQRQDKVFIGWKGQVVNSGKSYYTKMTGNIQFMFPSLLMQEDVDVTVESQSKIQAEEL